MKTAILFLGILSTLKAEVVPIPQGPGTPIEQLGSQAIVQGNYRDTTAWNMKNLSADYEGQVQEINQQPRYITERITAPPKVLTERVRTEPRYITENVSQPIRQRIITQPTVMNVFQKAQPQFVKAQDQFINKDPVYMPVQYKTEVINKPVNIPGNQVSNYTYVQPVAKTIREQVQIQQAPEIRRNLDPIYRDAQVQNNERVRTVQVPSNTIWSQSVIQPIYQRENVRLNVQDSAPRTINNDPITRQAQFSESTRVKNVTIPGRTIYKQQTIRPTVTNEQVGLQILNSQPQYRTTQPQVLQDVVKQTSYRRNVPVVHNIPEFRNYPVPVPVVHRVPEYRDIPVRFELKEPEDDMTRNIQEIEMDISDLTGRGRNYNSGKGFSNTTSQDYFGNIDFSDEDYGYDGGYGRRSWKGNRYGMGSRRGYGHNSEDDSESDHHHHGHYHAEDFDISNLYHQQI